MDIHKYLHDDRAQVYNPVLRCKSQCSFCFVVSLVSYNVYELLANFMKRVPFSRGLL